MLIKFSYPYTFGILVHRSGKPALSSSDVCVSRIESIKCLFGKDVVAKHGPSTPVIHGALYFGIRGGEHICVLCQRTIRHRPYVCLLSRSWSWSPTGGGVVGRSSDTVWILLFLPRCTKSTVILQTTTNYMTSCFLTSIEACRF